MRSLRITILCIFALTILYGCDIPNNPLYDAILDRLTPDVIYVDASAPLNGDGQTWETAFTYLADALYQVDQVRIVGGPVPEVHVAQGVYYPDEAENPKALLFGEEQAPVTSFQVGRGIQLLGGYPNGGGTRNPTVNPTVLSADLGQDDTVGPTGVTENASDIVGTNAWELLVPSDNTLIDGFTLTGVDGWNVIWVRADPGDGGNVSSLTLSNLVFKGNNSGDGNISLGATNGGSISPTLIDVEFHNNTARYAVKIDIWEDVSAGNSCTARFDHVSFNNTSGSALGIWTPQGGSAEVILADVSFSENSSTDSGGAIFANAGDGTTADGDIGISIVNGTFNANQAVSSGGAIYFHGTPAHDNWLELVNCAFVGNASSGGFGGAIAASGPIDVSVINSTFTQNESFVDGGAIWLYNAEASIDNTILWNNSAGGSGNEVNLAISTTAAAVYRTSDIDNSNGSGGSWATDLGSDGGGNIDADPTFTTAPNNGDGNWSTTGDNNYGDLSLQSGSPAGNTGNNTYLPVDQVDIDLDGNTSEQLPLDIEGGPRIISTIVDMGALESL